MLETLIQAIWGPLGGVAAGVGAVVVALVLGRWQGGRDATAKRDAQDGKDYIKERRRQDEIDVGHGASDAERIKRLHEIANRRGAGKN